MPFKVELGVDSYRIIGPQGQEGPLYTYDQVACLKIGENLYYCDVQFDPTETEALEEQLVERVIQSYGEDAEVVDVLFPGEESEGDDPDEGGEIGPELVA